MTKPHVVGAVHALFLALTLGAADATAQDPTPRPVDPRLADPRAWDQGFEAPESLAVLPHRERADVVNRHLRARLDTLLPRLMREVGLDLWIAATRAAAEREGITCCVYTHPLGFHGHAAGPTIGMWDEQGPTPVRGDWPLHPGSCYAIEGKVTVPVPEWGGQPVQIKLEQDAVFDGERVRYLGGRQTRFHVIR